ncbi:MAG: nitrogen regulation protein NR(II) [Haloarculaceae archaeon]
MDASRAREDSQQATTVQLLLDHERNRRLLARRLAEDCDHEVVEAAPDDLSSSPFDVCILDAAAFERHREALAQRKAAVEPAFLPYLLLADDQRIDRLSDAAWDAVDEVLVTPISRRELTHRLDNLLERRRLSLDLERRTERSERRFSALFDTAPDPVVVTSPDGVVSEVNGAFAEAVGEPPEHLVGRSVADLGFDPADDVERLLASPETSPSSASTPSTVRLDADGRQPKVFELNVAAVTASDGTDERIAVLRDVTEREQREETLRRQNERLKEFASTIAHDLRNPLTIARGYLDLARETGDTDHFASIERAHDRMEQLIDEILGLARQGQLVVDTAPVSLEAVAGRAWKNVETDEATLVVADDAELLADESRLCECFENLFRNAVEHGTGADHPVTVRVGPLDDREGFYVEDDGPGIPAADRTEVFEAGYTTAEKGTGFGLAIVQQIVEAHDWEVAVTESEDGGARFEFRTES